MSFSNLAKKQNGFMIYVFVFYMFCGSSSLPELLGSTSHDKFILSNDYLKAEISSKGSLISLTNLELNKRHSFSDSPFLILWGKNKEQQSNPALTENNCKMVYSSKTPDNNQITFIFEHQLAWVELIYIIQPQNKFINKKIRLMNRTNDSFNISSIDLLNFALTPEPLKSIPYYGFCIRPALSSISDQSQPLPKYDNTVAWFHRGRQDGLFSTITTDFVLRTEKQGRFISQYWPGFIYEQNEVFESEWALLGVYERKGYFHKPYTVKESSLREFTMPQVKIRLDRAEIEAVTDAVQSIIKPGIYYTLVNGWGLGVPNIIQNQNDLDSYKKAIDILSKIPHMKSLHFTHSWCGLTNELRDQGLAMTLTPNEFVLKMIAYAKSKNVQLSPFIGISSNWPSSGPAIKHNNYRRLLTIDQQGKRRDNNIAISEEYIDFACKTIINYMKSDSHFKGQSFDFLYLRADYDKDHGYLTGKASLYPQYYNIKKMLRILRKEMPDVMLRGQIGWRELGPWLAEGMSLCHNAMDHQPPRQRNFIDFHIDHHFANNIRLSNWFANNCKMCPRYLMNSNSLHNGGWIRAWDYGAFEYAVISQIASGQVFGMLHNLPDEEKGEVFLQKDKDFLDKWINWQKQNLDLYLCETDLFGEPRPDGVDGYAYSNDQKTVLFLCNPTYRTHWVSVPLDEQIKLTHADVYKVKELYPYQRNLIGPDEGMFNRKKMLTTDVPPQTVRVLQITPDNSGMDVLMSVSGTIKKHIDSYILQDLSGPAGSDCMWAIRVSDDAADSCRKFNVIHNGKNVPFNRNGNLLFGKLSFSGTYLNPQVTNYRIKSIKGRTNISAVFDVPAVVKEQLKNNAQTMPVSKKYSDSEWLNRTAWLDRGRFLIFIAAAPYGIDVDQLRSRNGNYEKYLKTLTSAKAKINGHDVTVHQNLMGNKKWWRWSGWFIDVGSNIVYDQKQILNLDLPNISENDFHGIYLPNLQNASAAEVKFQPPPSDLPVKNILSSKEAFVSNPKITETQNQVTMHLNLSITAQINTSWNPQNIRISNGMIYDRVVTGSDPRWKIDPKKAEAGFVLLGYKPKNIRFSIKAPPEAVLELEPGTDGCQIRLSDIIKKWKTSNDPFASNCCTVKWPDRKANIKIELTGPLPKKETVIHNF